MRNTLSALVAVFATLACSSSTNNPVSADAGGEAGDALVSGETSGEGGTGTGTCGTEGSPCCLIGTKCSSSLVCEGGTCKKVTSTGTGKSCFSDSECASGICITVGSSSQKVCSTSCTSTTGCVKGWSCSSISGRPSQVCQCYRATETCDGQDNDCDGQIDDGASTSCQSSLGTGASCVAGQCQCSSGSNCGGQCVNTTTDIYNCGTCGKTCYGTNQVCTGGQCLCSSSGLTACSSSCVNTQTDSSNCGMCGYRCDFPSTCQLGQCKCPNAGEQMCNSMCTNTTTSSTNCGICGKTCAGPCSASTCTNASQLSTRGNHTCARLTDGAVRCWGSGTSGQIGDGAATTRYKPVAVGTLSVAEVVAGDTHTCARMTDGSVQCWGSNSSGQIGDGSSTTTPRYSPSPVSLTGVTQLAAGTNHTCARTSGAALWCWGSNATYQLGDGGSTATRYSPYQVPMAAGALSNVAEVAVGRDHTCARMTDGTVKCWGSNTYGQLGNASTSTTATSTPQTVMTSELTTLSNVVQIVAGQYHTCARLTGGTVRCWGYNSNYQLGVTSNTTATASLISSLSGVTSIAAGASHMCAIASGSFWCWGSNASGQFGNGTTGMYNTPAQITAVVAPLEIAAGASHTCVRTSDAVRCMGAGSSGQIGDGGSTTRYSPTLVTW